MFKQFLTLNNFLKNGLHIGMRATKLNNYQNKFTLGIFKCFTVFNYRGIFLEIFRFWNIFSLMYQHQQIKYFLENCLSPELSEMFPVLTTESLNNYSILKNISNVYRVPTFLNLFNLSIFTNTNISKIQQDLKKPGKNVFLLENFLKNFEKETNNLTVLLYSKKVKNIQLYSKRKVFSLKKFAFLPFLKKENIFHANFLDSEESPQNIPYKFFGNTKFLSTIYFFSQIFLQTQNVVRSNTISFE